MVFVVANLLHRRVTSKPEFKRVGEKFSLPIAILKVGVRGISLYNFPGVAGRQSDKISAFYFICDYMRHVILIHLSATRADSLRYDLMMIL